MRNFLNKIGPMDGKILIRLSHIVPCSMVLLLLMQIQN